MLFFSIIMAINNQVYFLRRYLFIFLERGREGEREGEKHQCAVASHTYPTGDLDCSPSLCPRLGIELVSF